MAASRRVKASGSFQLTGMLRIRYGDDGNLVMLGVV